MGIVREESYPVIALGEPLDKTFGLCAGLYMLVAPSGAGKSLASACMAVAATCRSAYCAVNESHGTPLSLSWLARNLGSGHVNVSHFDVGDAGSLPFPSTPVVVLDSFTWWCWTAERIETSRESTVAQTRRTSFVRRSSAKRGGVTGELQEFLYAIDTAALRARRCLIGTLNTDQYPVGRDRVDDRHGATYSLFKGICTGVVTPHMVKGGTSYVEISDRQERELRSVTLTLPVINAALPLVGLKQTEQPAEQVTQQQKAAYTLWSRR